MCDPGTLTFMALSAATATAGVVGQKQQADAQFAYQEENIKSNKVVAMQQMADVRLREAQESEALSRKQQEASIEGRQARSTAITAAGDSGAAGNSVNSLLQDLTMKEGRYKEALGRQKDFVTSGAAVNIESIKTGNAYENKQIGRPVTQPNYLASALRVASDTYAFSQR